MVNDDFYINKIKLNRHKVLKTTLREALLRYVSYEDLVFIDKNKDFIQYVNNENYPIISQRIMDENVSMKLEKELSIKEGRINKHIITIKFLDSTKQEIIDMVRGV